MEYFGSGVQHIAFATADIYATAATLRAKGIESLPIPETYYDDVGARWGVDPSDVQRMKNENLLYDKDESGEYLQLYTRSFKDLFFVEIVERRSYQGFGAANAPTRLAAQSRLGQRLSV